MSNPNNYASEAYKACLCGIADSGQQQSAAGQIALLNGDKALLLDALKEMLLHFGSPKRDEWMNDAAWREALATEARARAAIDRSQQ